jgi:hypothetical protein
MMERHAKRFLFLFAILNDLSALSGEKEYHRAVRVRSSVPWHAAAVLIPLRGGRHAKDHSDEEEIDVIR